MRTFRCSFICLLGLLCIWPYIRLQSAPRKKVALVLSGGGAKGVAHIGAIKVMEELGIPVDYVVGTSIGAIVGGLYSVGYSPEQLEQIVKQTDWMELLTDKTSRKLFPFPFKADQEKFLLSLPLEKGQGGGGLIQGRNILHLLHELTGEYRNVAHFDSLPIPFACVATDMVTNRKVVLRSGDLAEALRASMAIPVVFAPVYSEGKVLVDGGFKDNLPTEVAKEMGADLIVTVDAQSDLAGEEKLHAVPDIVNQLMLMICQSESERKKEASDVYMKVDVTGYTAASFTAEALDSLLVKGERAARVNKSSLLEVKRNAGEMASVPERKMRALPVVTPQKKTDPAQEKQLQFGLRFDTELIAALLVNVRLPLRKGVARLALRGGRQSFIEAQYALPLDKRQELTLSNRFEYNDIPLYCYGKKACNPTYLRNLTELGYRWTPADNLWLGIGAQLDYYYLLDLLSAGQEALFPSKRGLYVNYAIQGEYDTFDKKYFPVKGIGARLGYHVYTDTHEPDVCSALDARIRIALPLSGHTVLLPMLYGRMAFNSRLPFVYGNKVGGEGYNRYFTHQLPFSGINYVESVEAVFCGAQLKVQQKVGRKQYLSLTGNGAVARQHLARLFKGEHFYGASLGYGYESPVGPIEAFLNYSNRTRHVEFYLNVGFGF